MSVCMYVHIYNVCVYAYIYIYIYIYAFIVVADNAQRGSDGSSIEHPFFAKNKRSS